MSAAANDGIQSLSGREKETLRLLLRGHDAKSIARALGLSVHTVNERLRDARRKLGVSSSREAARLLGEAEQRDPENFGDEEIGVDSGRQGLHSAGAPKQNRGSPEALPWILGGSFIMSALVAAVLFLSAPASVEGHSSALAASTADLTAVPDTAGSKAAAAWLKLVDAQRWEQSWQAAGTMFRSQLTATQWTAAVAPVRKPLGPVSKRALLSGTKHSSLPGAPAGEYEKVEFKTDFANKKEAVETLFLAREGSGWKVIGYFVR